MKMGMRNGINANSRFDFVTRHDILSKSKRSQAHVEIMLSFVLFVGVLIFIFLFINPFSRTSGDDLDISNVQKMIIGKMSSDIGKLSVIVENVGGCYYVDTSDYGASFKMVEGSGSKQYVVYFSKENGRFDNVLNNEGTSVDEYNSECNDKSFSLGSYLEEEMIVSEKIESLKSEYDSYSELKEELGLVNDFAFSFREVGGESEDEGLSVSGKIPQGADVKSRVFPVRVIDKNANVRELILNLKVW